MPELDALNMENISELPDGYRMTELGPLPEEWRVVRLGEVAYVKQGRTPRLEHYDDLIGYRIIKVKDFDDGAQVSVVPRGERSFTTIDLGDAVRVKAEDILILNAGHSPQVVGQKVGIVPKALEGAFFVAELTAIRAFRVEPYFLFGVMMLPGTRNIIRSKVKGGHLYVSQLKTLPIPLPPLPEQRAIAHVLRTVQKAKEATERVIAALRELKKSLMRHLFTYGPVPLDVADRMELKDTEIGPIPSHWRVVRLGEVADFMNGINFKREDRGKGILTIDVFNMYTDDIYPKVSDLYRVNVSVRPDRLLKPGDLLFVRSSLKREGVGWTVLFPGYHEPVTFCGFVIRGRLHSKEILPEFMVYFFRLPSVRELMVSKSGKVAITNINQGNLKAIPIPVPPLPEQREIARILRTVEEKIQAEEKRKEALEALFKAFLHYLMTAKIRLPKEFVTQFEGVSSSG